MAISALLLDLETKSDVDLMKSGVYQAPLISADSLFRYFVILHILWTILQ